MVKLVVQHLAKSNFAETALHQYNLMEEEPAKKKKKIIIIIIIIMLQYLH